MRVGDTGAGSATVLVIDHDDLFHRGLRRAAAAARLAVVSLFDASRAVDFAVEYGADLIILDILIPHINGRDVLWALKNDPRTRHIPVMAHAGPSKGGSLSRLDLGADGYLERPMPLCDVVSRIQKQLRTRKADDAANARASLKTRPDDLCTDATEAMVLEGAESSRWPRMPPDEIDRWQVATFDADQEERESQPRIAVAPPSSGRSVLVVEDDASIRQSISTILEEEGYATLSACNGQEALDLLHRRADPPSVILLDLMMPVMDGWEFRKHIAKDSSIPPIPVVVMSAKPAEHRGTEQYAWLQKPLNLANLLTTLNEASTR
ncbi:MAG TPA: response regulator [Polyangiaceae bacterium]|nr:response regulator [Polyangiaceae bacterium]